MNETNEQQLAAARAYVTDIYTHRSKEEFVFHNLEHTEDVVEACSHMADYYELPDNERLVLMLAAWFHDTGYTTGESEGHEDVSAQLATQFLQSRHADEPTIQRVVSCIQATKMPQSPITQIEKILCDADLYHLSTEDFKARNQLLKQERENQVGHKIDKKEWRKSNIKFLSTHKYFTEYGQEMLEPKKMENLIALQKKKPDKVEDIKNTKEAFPYIPVEEQKMDAKTAQKSTERGVQTMFRILSTNHLRLSSMADNKSHIMITVNSIILSIVISVLFGKLSFYKQYVVPACILLAVCLGSITFSILATRPSISGGRFTEEDIRNHKTNLLFFGNFYRMKIEEYQWAMQQLMKDADYLYNSMVKDVYYLGVVLAKKYRFLRISYTIFMIGIIVAVIAFAISGFIAVSGAGPSNTPVIDY
jgi:predicted metal-dependent HD superfamily phosphohydrolase